MRWRFYEQVEPAAGQAEAKMDGAFPIVADAVAAQARIEMLMMGIARKIVHDTNRQATLPMPSIPSAMAKASDRSIPAGLLGTRPFCGPDGSGVFEA